MITLVGAGPVGSLWALLLKQKGFDVQVFEKRPDPRLNTHLAGRSINLIITSRGIYGLEKAGLMSLVDKISVPVFGRMIHSKTGELTYQAYGQKNECNYSVSRAEINNSLITEAEKAGVKFYFAHDLQHLDLPNKSLTFQCGNETVKTKYEILFGSDGSGSQLRKQLVQLFPTVKDETHWLEADYKELTLPLNAEGKPQLKTDALHIWPRGAHMMMALANRDGSFTVTVYLPKNNNETKSEWGFNKLTGPDSVKQLFASEFSDAIAMMPNYLNEFSNNPQGHLGTVRCNHWVFENSIALMGDAAHAIVPFFGQGMNCGFEDCTALLELFEKNPHNWPFILSEYERTQKPNADAIADMALENWVEMKEKVGDARFLLRKKIESALEQKYPNVFKARYGLITYTLTPYSLAQKAGLVQNEIIDSLMAEAASLEDVSWTKAEQLIESKWMSFVRQNSLDIKVYPKKD